MLHVRRTSALPLLSLLVAATGGVVRAEERGDQIAAALQSAGYNRAQIQAALDKVPAAQADGMRFLVANMPQDDLQKLSAEFLLSNVDYAYRAASEAPWKDRIPPDVFLNYVLPYAAIDEDRDDWRKDFYERFKPLVADAKEPGRAAVVLNQKIFPQLKVRFSTGRRAANQGPYETIKTGVASCTGLSILLIDACRAVGVPARFVGTPLWTDRSGNHSWVEVWDGKQWRYTGAAEPAGDELDQSWFTGRAATAQRDHKLHAIYAARFERSPQVFPSAWSPRQAAVPAVNVTDRYLQDKTPRAEGAIVVRFRVLDKPGGGRVAAQVTITDEAGKTIAAGETRDDRFDPNDHLEAVVAKDQKLHVEIRGPGGSLSKEVQPAEDQALFTYSLDE